MIILGVSILGNLNKTATSSESLGEAFWRIVIASGILACIIGLVNIFASYAFRNKSLGITARQVRMHGNLAHQKVYIPPSAAAGPGSSVYSTPQLSAKPTVSSHHNNNRRRSFWLNARRSNTLPSYHPPQQQTQPIRNISAPIGSGAGPGMTQNVHSPAVVNYSLPGGGNPYGGIGEKTPNISQSQSGAGGRVEEGCAPVINGIQRPDLAHHPALQGGRF